MNKSQLKKLRKKYSLKTFLSDEEYDKAKFKYTNVNVKPICEIEDLHLGPRSLYMRNPKLKGQNVEYEFTQEMITEYHKCKEDPVYFINAYAKIVHVDFGLIPFNLRPFQEDIVQVANEFNKVILNTSRQVGKCVHGDTLIEILEQKNMGILNRLISPLFSYLMTLRTRSITELNLPKQKTMRIKL